MTQQAVAGTSAAAPEPAHVHADGSHDETREVVPQLRLLPLRHTKVVHLIRHSQGFHNVAGKECAENYKSCDYLDAHLTPLGWQQAFALRSHLRSLGAAFRADVVVISPLTRTLETAAGAFGAGEWHPGDATPAFMLPQQEVAGRRAAQAGISAAGCPPLVAWEGCREHLGVHPCDRRRRIREIGPSFPAVDFSLIESDEDALWRADYRESKEEIKRRGLVFMQWLMRRPEAHIAVVAHSGFLWNLASNFGHDASPAVQGELHRWYENAECRSLVLACEGGSSGRSTDDMHFHGGLAAVNGGGSSSLV